MHNHCICNENSTTYHFMSRSQRGWTNDETLYKLRHVFSTYIKHNCEAKWPVNIANVYMYVNICNVVTLAPMKCTSDDEYLHKRHYVTTEIRIGPRGRVLSSSTVLQAAKSPSRLRTMSLDFSNDIIPPSAIYY